MMTVKSSSKEINRSNESLNFAVKFANMVFILGILFSVLTVVYTIYKIYNQPENITSTFYYLSFLFAILTAVMFLIGFIKLSEEIKVNMSVLFLTMTISIYAFEIYLQFVLKELQPSVLIAKKMGIPYDTKTKMEMIDDLIDSGINAHLNIFPTHFINSNGLRTNVGNIFPMGTISNVTTILSNESGNYPVVVTDEHGFNNPKGLYKKNNIDIILTGDSFTEGFSVGSNENIGALLRQSDYNAISIGKASNGSLIELAALKEYGEPLKPKIVLWVYYVNDISNLLNEMESPLLRKYLNDNTFSQNLISRQGEIDSLLVDYLVEEMEKEREKEKVRKRERVFDIIQLTNLRKRINLTPKSAPKPTPTPTPTPIFKEIMQKAKQMVSGWEGQMYFVYLPPYTSYLTGTEEVNRHFALHTAVNRDFVLQIVSDLDIPIIDIHKEVFIPHPDPLSLFPFRIYPHYTAEGYELVAKTISKRLRKDETIPLN